MLKVKGNFIVTDTNTKVPYTAYYFLLDEHYPRYIVGIKSQSKDSSAMETFMDEFVSHVKPEENN